MYDAPSMADQDDNLLYSLISRVDERPSISSIYSKDGFIH
jgi:hypothetical protein